MSRESDKVLLVAYETWAGEPMDSATERVIDVFLASRPPQADGCVFCGHSRELHDDAAPLRVSHEFVRRSPQATEPQEFWAVGPTFAPAGHWLCVRVYRDGTHNQYGVPRKTRDEAEADGLASGLPRWHEAIPAALPTEETKPEPESESERGK